MSSRIYAAEDDDNIREILRCTLESYGYGSREELTAAGACFLAEQPADIANYVLGK